MFFVRINQVYTSIVAAIVLKYVASSRERENKLVFDNITVLIGFCNITQDKRKVSQNFLTSIISSNLINQSPNNRVIVCLDLLNHQNTCTRRLCYTIPQLIFTAFAQVNHLLNSMIRFFIPNLFCFHHTCFS